MSKVDQWLKEQEKVDVIIKEFGLKLVCSLIGWSVGCQNAIPLGWMLSP